MGMWAHHNKKEVLGMPRGRSSTPDHIVRQCFILQEELRTYSAIGRRLNLAPNTVKRILNDKDNIAKYGDLMQEIAKIQEKANNEIIQMIDSNRYSELANNIMDLFTQEALEEELKKLENI